MKTKLPPKITSALGHCLALYAGSQRKRKWVWVQAYSLPSSHSYIPVLMAQARIYWDTEDYQQVEKIFRKSVEFCSEHNTWKLNVAHVLFMQVGDNTVSFPCHLTTWE